MRDYFRELGERLSRGWDAFWFTPADPIVLSVIRVLAGLSAFYFVATFTPDVIVLFGPEGLLPADSMARMQSDFFRFSYLYLLETPDLLMAGHALGLVVVALFTLGLFTRVTSVLSLLVVLSYIHRGFILTAEMEPILVFVMLYLCIGPSGAYFSIDRLWRRRKAARTEATTDTPPASWAANIAVRLIQVHLTAVYVMMAIGQLNESTWWDGTAIWWMAGRHDSALMNLTWMHSMPYLVNIWTHGFVLFELAFAVFAWNRLAAPLIVACSMVVWPLMAIVTGLAPFATMMMIAGLVFLAPSTMHRLLVCCLPRAALK